MERPQARPRNFFNTEQSGGRKNESQRNDQSSPPQKTRRGGRDRTRSGGGGRESTVENDSDLDAAELNRKVERLQRDLVRRDRELEDERHENQKALDKIKKLERDKVELKRDLEDFRLEAEEYKRTLDEYKAQIRTRRESVSSGNIENGDSDPNANIRDEDYRSSNKNYELTMNQKNREISQLIEDIEVRFFLLQKTKSVFTNNKINFCQFLYRSSMKTKQPCKRSYPTLKIILRMLLSKLRHWRMNSRVYKQS